MRRMFPSKSEVFSMYEKFFIVILIQYSKSLERKMFAQKYRMNEPGMDISSSSIRMFAAETALFIDRFFFLKLFCLI